jgi:hypothetical protein
VAAGCEYVMKAEIRHFDAEKVRDFADHPRNMLGKCDNDVVYAQFQ